jgi:hypothetical protein
MPKYCVHIPEANIEVEARDEGEAVDDALSQAEATAELMEDDDNEIAAKA